MAVVSSVPPPGRPRPDWRAPLSRIDVLTPRHPLSVHMFHPFGSLIGPNAKYVDTSSPQRRQLVGQARTTPTGPDVRFCRLAMVWSGRSRGPRGGPGVVDRPALGGSGARPPGPAWPARGRGAVPRAGRAPVLDSLPEPP